MKIRWSNADTGEIKERSSQWSEPIIRCIGGVDGFDGYEHGETDALGMALALVPDLIEAIVAAGDDTLVIRLNRDRR